MHIIQNNDITALCETKINDYVTTSSLMLPGYSIFRQDRNSNGGGIVTFIKDNLFPTECYNLQNKYVKLRLEISIIQIKMYKPSTKAQLVYIALQILDLYGLNISVIYFSKLMLYLVPFSHWEILMLIY